MAGLVPCPVGRRCREPARHPRRGERALPTALAVLEHWHARGWLNADRGRDLLDERAGIPWFRLPPLIQEPSLT